LVWIIKKLGTRVLGHYIVIYWYWRICFKKKNDIWTPIAFKKRYWTPASSLPLFIELFEWLFTLGIVFSCSYIVQVYQLRHCHHLVEILFFYILVSHRDDLCSSTGIWPFSCRLTTVLYKLSCKGVNFIPRAPSLCVDL
jgi:hypothetical protein